MASRDMFSDTSVRASCNLRSRFGGQTQSTHRGKRSAIKQHDRFCEVPTASAKNEPVNSKMSLSGRVSRIAPQSHVDSEP